MPQHVARLRVALGAPVDAAGLVAFRVLFGVLAALASARFVALGWVEELLLRPTFHFAWVPGLAPAPAPVLYAVFGLQFVAGVAVAAGVRSRVALGLWLLSFGYIELLDKALYLNHYVLFTLLGVWLWVSPVHGDQRKAEHPVPAWSLALLRAQVASVYLWAGLAKLNPDWLLAAQPLRTWLGARADVPLLGALLAHPTTAFVMSWAGAAYDLLIPFILLTPRLRVLGLLLVLGFHVAVGLLFPIGVFPLVMLASATLFLDPAWPRRVRARVGERLWPILPAGCAAVLPGDACASGADGLASSSPAAASASARESAARRPLGRAATLLFGVTMLLMFVFPARFLVYGSRPSWTDVNWSERGYRFAWRVLLNEKTGLVDFRVVERVTGHVWRVMPSHELSAVQHAQLRTQPDLMRDYALHLQAEHRRAGRDVAVYADAWASLNGRPTRRLLRDDVDLTQPLAQLERQGWILPLSSAAR